MEGIGDSSSGEKGGRRREEGGFGRVMRERGAGWVILRNCFGVLSEVRGLRGCTLLCYYTTTPLHQQECKHKSKHHSSQ